MEMKNKVILEIVKEDLPYRLELPAGCPLGDAYQVVGKFMDKMVELINQHQQKRTQEEEKSGESEDQKPEENQQSDA